MTNTNGYSQDNGARPLPGPKETPFPQIPKVSSNIQIELNGRRTFGCLRKASTPQELVKLAPLLKEVFSNITGRRGKWLPVEPISIWWHFLASRLLQYHKYLLHISKSSAAW